MESQQKINLLRVRDFTSNFSTIIEFTKQNYSSILKGICYVIVIGVITVTYFFTSMNTNMNKVTDITDIHEVLAIYKSWRFPVGFITLCLMSLIINTFVICYISKYDESDSGIVNISSVWKKVSQVIIPLLVYSIIYGIIISFGFVLCLIPGIILAIFFTFYSYIYVVEKLSLVDTFKRSWKLVKDSWFTIFGIQLIIGIVILIITFLVNFSLSSLRVIGTTTSSEFLGGDIFLYITNLIINTISMLLSPIPTIATGILYFSCRADVDKIETNDNIKNIGSYNRYY